MGKEKPEGYMGSFLRNEGVTFLGANGTSRERVNHRHESHKGKA